MKFLVAAFLASLSSACASGGGATVQPEVSSVPVTAVVEAGSVVVAMSSQDRHAWTIDEIHTRVDAALEGEVSPWQPTLVSPLLPDFEKDAVVVAVYTLGETGEEADEYRAMRGFAVRIDLQSGAARSAEWGIPMHGDEAYERVIPRGFASDAARQAESDQALLDLMSGTRSESALTHAISSAADWFDVFPVYRDHLASKMGASIEWLRGARGGELAR